MCVVCLCVFACLHGSVRVLVSLCAGARLRVSMFACACQSVCVSVCVCVCVFACAVCVVCLGMRLCLCVFACVFMCL